MQEGDVIQHHVVGLSWGGYHAQSLVGHGGMGLIYLAVHVQTGQEVIIKTLRPHADEHAREAMMLEVQALDQLEHPNMVRLIEHGQKDRVPWFAMEVLQGQTLAQLLSMIQIDEHKDVDESALSETSFQTMDASLSSVDFLPPELLLAQQTLEITIATPPPLSEEDSQASIDITPTPTVAIEQLLDVFEGVCHALAYIHGEGWVHGDVTPNNIMIDPQRKATLFDFGLVTRVEHRVHLEQLKRAGMLAGTAAYLSPEQIRGETVDARSDLYSLGCILYQCVTGVLPFTGSLNEMLAAHLNVQPKAPSELGLEIEPELESLLMRLLSKSPSARPGHAFAVWSVLNQLGGVRRDSRRIEEVIKPYLISPPLLGRDEVVDQLRQELDFVDIMTGTSCLVLGDAGMGKSHLALEVVRYARHSGFFVLPTGQTVEGYAEPLSLFVPLLEKLLSMVSPAQLRAESSILSLLLPYCPALEKYLGPTDQVNSHKTRVFDALISALDLLRHQSGTDRGLCLVVDDLQWADDLSLEALTHIIERAMPIQPWMIVGFARQDAFSAHNDHHIIQQLLGTVDTIIDLVPLRPEMISNMVEHMLGGMRPPRSMVAFLCQHASGNPLFVVEYLQMMVAQRLISPSVDGSWKLLAPIGAFASQLKQMKLPQQLLMLAHQRLQYLPEAMHEIVLILACANMPMTAAMIQQFMDQMPNVDLWLDQLMKQHLVVLQKDGYMLSHQSYVESIMAIVPRRDRMQWHHSFADYLAKQQAQGHDIDVSKLAWQYEQSGQQHKAYGLYVEVAREAFEQRRFFQAAIWYEDALRLSDEQPMDVRHVLMLDLAEQVLVPMGRFLRCHELLDIIKDDQAKQKSPVNQKVFLRRVLLRGRLLNFVGRRPEAAELLDIAESIIDADDERQLVNLYKLRTGVLDGMGEYQAALDLYEKALPLAQKHGMDYLEADLFHNRGLVFKHVGRINESIEDFERALTLYSALNYKPRVALARQNMGLVFKAYGRIQDALACLTATRQYHEQHGSYITASTQQLNEAVCLADLGLFDQAWPRLQKLLERPEKFCTTLTMSLIEHQVGNLAARWGQFKQAGQAYGRAIELIDDLKVRRSWSLIHVNAAYLNCYMGDPQKAIDRIEEIVEDHQNLDFDVLYEMQNRLAASYFWSGDVAKACALLRQVEDASSQKHLMLRHVRAQTLRLMYESHGDHFEEPVIQKMMQCRQVLATVELMGDRYMRARMERTMAEYAARQGRQDRAMDLYARAAGYFQSQSLIFERIYTVLSMIRHLDETLHPATEELNQWLDLLSLPESHLLHKYREKLISL